MNIAVLFDGAGLARLGLEQAGHTCIGIELDPFRQNNPVAFFTLRHIVNTNSGGYAGMP